jgi:hypothetical protein
MAMNSPKPVTPGDAFGRFARSEWDAVVRQWPPAITTSAGPCVRQNSLWKWVPIPVLDSTLACYVRKVNYVSGK